MIEEQFNCRVHGLIRQFRKDLAKVAQEIPGWVEKWKAKHTGTELANKWDHYRSDFLRGPLWDKLTGYQPEELLRILWNWCSTHLSCLPGPVVMLHLRWTLKIVHAYPERFGRSYTESPVLRFYGLLNEHSCPDGVSAIHWEAYLGRALITLSGKRVLRQEFNRVREMMASSGGHPLYHSFFSAVARGEMLMERASLPTKPQRLVGPNLGAESNELEPVLEASVA